MVSAWCWYALRADGVHVLMYASARLHLACPVHRHNARRLGALLSGAARSCSFDKGALAMTRRHRPCIVGFAAVWCCAARQLCRNALWLRRIGTAHALRDQLQRLSERAAVLRVPGGEAAPCRCRKVHIYGATRAAARCCALAPF